MSHLEGSLPGGRRAAERGGASALGARARGRLPRASRRRPRWRQPGRPAAAAAPARIGDYRIVRELGQGGMGTVYLAERDEPGFRRTVAIKVVRPGMETGFVLRRFQTERQILASLENPGIARLYDGGTTEEGLPYFVMEFVEGTDLLTWCDERKLPVPERLRLFRRVCDAVQFAHQNLVVHRDLKPTNILVTPAGEPEAARLRHRQAALAGGFRGRGDRDPRASHDAGLRQPGADPRAKDHHRERRVRARRRSLRAAVGPASVLPAWTLSRGDRADRRRELSGTAVCGGAAWSEARAPRRPRQRRS